MPQAIPFDTHAAVKMLVASGFTEDQAEAQTDLIKELVEEQLVTKQYLDEKLAEFETRFKLGISENKVDTLKWVAGMLLAQTGVIAALVKLL